MAIYKRIFAWVYQHVMGGPDPNDDLTRNVRIPLLKLAQGRVLEVGAGTGANLRLYPPDISLTVLEPNPYMLNYLRENAAQWEMDSLDTVEAPAEAIPFPDQHFDTVVTTHVLCSVGNLEYALAEVRRVLKPGGRFLFLEHVAAQPDTPTHRLQRWINPVWKMAGDGCHLTRDTGEAIRQAGFEAVEVNDIQADYPGLISPHVYGWAQR